MRTKHRAKLPVTVIFNILPVRGIILFIAANFNMFGDCLGVLDSCAGAGMDKNGNLRSALGTRSKWAVATIAWDVEFLAWGAESHHAPWP